ncbi:hypothetical protein AGMMS49942_13050 [Spirochaetia bacterium]|nr:hypothetical protein AGMMS49942_13050 [Spirochaetia bacterium]
MILDTQHKAAFEGYEKPLRKLEKAFFKTGIPLQFFLHEDPFNNRMVEIIGNGSRQKVICIEGDSPAQAVKDVAAAVKLQEVKHGTA